VSDVEDAGASEEVYEDISIHISDGCASPLLEGDGRPSRIGDRSTLPLNLLIKEPSRYRTWRASYDLWGIGEAEGGEISPNH